MRDAQNDSSTVTDVLEDTVDSNGTAMPKTILLLAMNRKPRSLSGQHPLLLTDFLQVRVRVIHDAWPSVFGIGKDPRSFPDTKCAETRPKYQNRFGQKTMGTKTKEYSCVPQPTQLQLQQPR
jgi:hypothetical protein